MEPLRPASSEEIKHLIHIYEQHLPESVQFVLLLQNILRMNTTLGTKELADISHRFRKTVYVPKTGNLTQFATFVAISLEKDPFIMVHSLESPPTELMNAVRFTQYIRWNVNPVFVFGGADEIRSNIYKIITERNLKAECTSDCMNYWLPREIAEKLNYVVPSDVELKRLQLAHGKQLNEWWPYRYKTSQWYMESTIQHNAALGLFDKASGQLMACVAKNDHDGVGHVFTVPDRCNRGYGATLVAAMSRLIAEDHKQHVHAFISESNVRSIRLFEKIGYIPVNRTKWFTIS